MQVSTDRSSPAALLTREQGELLSRGWNATLALVVAASLIVQIALLVLHGTDVTTGVENEAVSVATRLVRLFSYFTIQSNLLVLATAISLAVNPNRDGPLWRVLRLDALIGIVITGIVFATVLASQVQLSGAAQWTNVGFHYFSPWWTLLGWLLFGPRPRITWRAAAWAFVWPVLWLAYIFAYGAQTGWYPYPFLNVTNLGFALAVRNVGFVLLLALIAVVVFKLLDKLPTASRS